MKVNTPGKLFEAKFVFEDKIYEIFPKNFKPKYSIFGTLLDNNMSFNVTMDKLQKNTFSDDVINLGIKYKFIKQGKITWLEIPSYYFNYENK